MSVKLVKLTVCTLFTLICSGKKLYYLPPVVDISFAPVWICERINNADAFLLHVCNKQKPVILFTNWCKYVTEVAEGSL